MTAAPADAGRPAEIPATAWLVGASSGIVAALARRLAAAGTRVVVSARSTGALADVAAEDPSRISAWPLDVTDAAGCRHAANEVSRQLGAPPDLVVFGAGTWQQVDVDSLDPGIFERAITVNYMGAVNVLAAVLPEAIARGAGHIALIASVAGYRGLPSAAAYGSSKAAVINLCESLAPELAQRGVRLRLVDPGFVATPMTAKNDFPMPFLISADDAAERLMRGLTRSSRFEITFPKRFTWILKLLRLLPYALYFAVTRRIARKDSGKKT